MKKILILLIVNLFMTKELISSDLIYETNFYNVDINNEIIIDAKIREIDNIKKKSFESVLKNILTKQEFNKLKRKINFDKEVNYLIKNILINDEFISQKKYKAKVKINFNYIEIINLLRKYKINYSDLKSPNFLIVVAEDNQLSIKGMSKDNSFYDNIPIKNFGLINFKYPELSPNDRYILPYKKIIKKDLHSLKLFSLKYKVDYIFVILSKFRNKITNFNINIYSLHDNSFNNLGNLTVNSNKKKQLELFNYLNEWWKTNNIINNSIITNKLCSIENSNIQELYYINSKINSISQVKTNIVNQINLGANINNISFYGELSNFSKKLLNSKINLSIDLNQNCILFTIN